MKDKKGNTVLIAFMEIVIESNLKPNRSWVDQGGEFYNKSMQEWLDKLFFMYSAHNGSKSLIDVMFIKRLKTKIYKKMTANNSKSDLSYLNKLVDQYNSLYHHYFN